VGVGGRGLTSRTPEVGTTELKRDRSSLEEWGQLAYDKFMIAEKDYKKSLPEFEGSI
jgi:hypothetical protein